MNYLDKLTKNIKSKQRKQKANSINNFAAFAVLGVAIGGTFAGIFARRCLDEIRSTTVSNEKNINEEVNIKRDEIKQTLKKTPDKCVGDVGAAMEKALDDLSDDKQDENEVTN